ncbi:hypothetical protein AB0Q93_27695, partial [Streptomyces sp. NPDC088184]
DPARRGCREAPDMTYYADTAIPGAMEFGQVTHSVWGVLPGAGAFLKQGRTEQVPRVEADSVRR